MRIVSKWLSALVLTGGLVGIAATSASAQSSAKKPVGWLGVTIQDLTSELSESLPRGVTEGALVNGVLEDSPAELAGLEEGDIIVKFDQLRVRNSNELTQAVREAEPGHVAVIEFYRDGGRQTVEAKVAKQKNAAVWKSRGEGRRHSRRGPEHPKAYTFDNEAPHGFAFLMGDTPRLGVQLVDLTDQLSGHFGVESGVLISEVVEGSAAETAGLRAGDIIVAVAGEPTENSGEVRDELGRVDVGTVEISVMRDGKRQEFTAELTKPRKSRMSGFYGPGDATMFNIPDVGWDQAELKEQMDALREEMNELREELSQLRKEPK